MRPPLNGRPLQLLAGSERIEAGWRDGASTARDHFIARANDGALVWAYGVRLTLPLAQPEGEARFPQERLG